MTRQEFFDWAEIQDTRYKFDGFQPVAIMGGSIVHSRLIRNVNFQLTSRLRGKTCKPLGPEAGMATVGGTVRYPDAVVSCTSPANQDRLVPNPMVVFGVIGPSSVRIDRAVRLRQYGAVPTIRRYVIVESDAAAVTVLSRDGAGEPFRAAGLGGDDTLDFPEIGIEIPVVAIYGGIAFGEKDKPGA